MNVLFAASLAGLVGCSPTMEPDGWEFPSTLAFSYSGAITGTFSVSGNLSDVIPTTGFAVGGHDPDYTGTTIVAFLPRTATTSDVVYLMIPRLTSGSSMVDVACTTPGCAGLALMLGLASAEGPAFLQMCSFTTGTLDLIAISESRATGNFSGTGECVSSAFTSTGAFTVTGGTFDVAIGPTDFE